MSIEISPPHVDELKPRIAVIGVGGAGGNAIANMIAASVEGVDFIVANTDAQALNASPAERRIQLGPQITEGLGAGSRPEIGRAAAEETIITVEQALEGAHMCFITAGMGGGTGTGAAPVIAKAAREKGILTVGVVTKPFTFEGNRRMKSAESGIDELQKHVDTLIVIPNQNLFLIANPNTTFKEAFQMADEVLQQGVRSITDLMIMPGLINLDFADVRSVMGEMGKAMMGTGEAEGDGRALQAAEKAIANPLLDGVSMRGAKGVIVSIVGGDDMRLMEVDEAANHIRELVDPDANIIWGSAFNDNLNGKIRVSVVATGIDNEVGSQAAPLTQPFSFASRPAVAVPQAPRPAPVAAPAPAAPVAAVPAPVAAPEPEALELDVPEAPAPAPIAAPAAEKAPPAFAPARPAAVFSDEDPSQDELLLGAEAAEPTAPEAAPKPAQPAPRVATGGTLFERMAGLTRGSEKAPGTEEGTQGLDIPRFLNRQNNQ
ncbi:MULTISPECIES: cell division protein FtsZ [Sphingobium]|uniref:Cell division protein FtsZ n=1 Tax=Sphingobium yanoikuyae ATCC 51230 TaxID=883163 RepID=K9CWF6_SPHYA|nr:MULTISPECIES: cell division protein FtsZ [Sphingobium]EKU76594.1 cell division protein FtsZ [Sphingobium yanoikuyae ATCC 51230]WQE05361.1 cell division protein FtsZ [Sphingobium yanoikuyae]SHL81313.1 cell division protein FtsZ [Sphingobium sp. YR657]